jgi:hypothetical protein
MNPPEPTVDGYRCNGFNSPARRAATCSRRDVLALGVASALGGGLAALPGNVRAQPGALGFTLRGQGFVHRWSKGDQHEYTPGNQPDLKTWHDMVTLNVHAATRTGEQLADVANRVLGNYQRHGKVLQTRSRPRTASSAAEHLIVAVLGTPEFLEATFARCLMHDGAGLIAVRSRRVYGKPAGPAMSEWLKSHGQATEEALMAWSTMPSRASLDQLPRSA